MLRTGSPDEGMLEDSLATILREASTPEDSLASGSAAALSVALAAALTCSTARSLGPDPEASGFVVQAEGLRARAVELVGRNREHYAAARRALEARLEDPGFRDHRIGEAMKETLHTLGMIAGTGADTAALASNVAKLAPDDLRPDTVAASLLAEAGVKVAVLLVRANLLATDTATELDAAEAELQSARESCRQATALPG